jgi:mono/diheme cytochrome c family protein
MKLNINQAFVTVCGVAVGVVLVGAMSLIASRPAVATMQFTKETGKACGACHTAAKGGGPLTPFGEKFKANGNKLPAQTS